MELYFLSKLPIHSIITEIFFSLNYVPYGLPGGTTVKNAANARNTGDAGLIPGSGRYPEVRNETHSSILEWKICEQRNLEGYSPQGHKELDTTEQLSMHMYCILYDVMGEGIMNNTCLQNIYQGLPWWVSG